MDEMEKKQALAFSIDCNIFFCEFYQSYKRNDKMELRKMERRHDMQVLQIYEKHEINFKFNWNFEVLFWQMRN